MGFTLEELKGVPEDVVSGYTKREEDGKTLYDVTFKTPDIFPLVRSYRIRQASTANPGAFKFKFAENPETRRRAHEGYDNRLAINAPLLDKVLDLRRQIAKLLGYPTWADYRTEVKMVKTAANVHTVRVFLEIGDTHAETRSLSSSSTTCRRNSALLV